MMAKVSTEYYNLEKVAEVLSISTAEVNRLREQSKLRGFRDGSNWKFLKEDIHTYLAETIKARSANADNGHKPGDSDFDILGSEGSASSFDLLVENADSLPSDSQLVSANPQQQTPSDLDLAALDNNDDDLSLAEETRISAVPVMPKPKQAKSSTSAVLQDEVDSDLVLAPSSASKSDAVLLDDNESVLGGSGSSPQLGLAGDSGFDVLVAGDDDSDLLEVDIDGEKTSPVFAQKEDFVLEPAVTAGESDDSDSSSQVIAIDGGFGNLEVETSPFGDSFGTSDGFTFDSGVSPPAGADNNDPFGTTPFPDTSVMPTPVVSTKKTQAAEEEYSTGILVALICTLVVMLLPGMMLIDTMAHMWSWDSPFVLNSVLMNTISGWFGL